jgi:hypothetical protein
MPNTGANPTPPPPPPPPEPAKPSGGWKLTLGIFAALFLILTIAATACVLSSGSTAQPQAGGTPAGTVQAWATALEKGDYTTADTYLSSSIKSSGMTSRDLVYGEAVTNLTVDAVSTSGNSASVSVHYTTATGLTAVASLWLVLENGSWKITEPGI